MNVNAPPTEAEILAHFGYYDVESAYCWHNEWDNTPERLEDLATLPQFIKTLGTDKRFHITFDYDPEYPKMLLRAIVTNPSR